MCLTKELSMRVTKWLDHHYILKKQVWRKLIEIWVYIKNNVYADPITKKEELMNKVRTATNSLGSLHISNGTRSVMKRANKCLDVNGCNF